MAIEAVWEIQVIQYDLTVEPGIGGKSPARNRTTLHYGEPLQTVVNNCNPQFTRRTK